MQIGMIGLGRMGANMVARLQKAGVDCVVADLNPEAVQAAVALGATGSTSLQDLVSKLQAPRNLWLMIPAAAVDGMIGRLAPLLEAGDAIVDGGNSFYQDSLRRWQSLSEKGLHFVDVGTSGGIFGLERGYCLMIGGEDAVVWRLEAVFKALAPGVGAVGLTPSLSGATQAEQGYLHCGPSGAGHFVKMVHNGIEYGLMAAYAEGFNILKNADVGLSERPADAETTPLRNPEFYRYRLDLPQIAELWRRGSVVSSWLLDLTSQALQKDADLANFEGRVSDSGEGRWTLNAAIDESVPAPVLAAALFDRFASRGEAVFAEKLLSAMRYQFGGHAEKK